MHGIQQTRLPFHRLNIQLQRKPYTWLLPSAEGIRGNYIEVSEMTFFIWLVFSYAGFTVAMMNMTDVSQYCILIGH